MSPQPSPLNVSRQPMLGRLMLRDAMNHKLRWLLGLAVLASAFSVVLLAYENRLLTAELDNLREQHDDLGIERRHLMLEESALAEHSRIGQIATNQLEMVRPSVQQKTLVDVR